jgi:DNA-binding IclR family transcriptional regulator
MQTSSGQDSCPSVRNAFRLLESLAGSPNGMRLTRLAEATALPKSSVHRILATLEDLDIVSREPNGPYHLTSTWRHVVTPPTPTEFSAPVLGHNGKPIAGLTLRLPAPPNAHPQARPAHLPHLTRLVTDLAQALSRTLHPNPHLTRESNPPAPRVARS